MAANEDELVIRVYGAALKSNGYRSIKELFEIAVDAMVGQECLQERKGAINRVRQREPQTANYR